MTTQAVDSTRTNLDDLAGVLATLSDEEWQAASACPGWRIQDVVAHLNSSAKLLTGNQAPVDGDGGTEANAEAMIGEQKTWNWRQVYEEFETYTDGFIGALAGMQAEPIASAVTPLGDLGEHPTHLLANAFAFDSYCHLRHDILGPGTAVDRELPAADDLRLRPGIEWMLAGLPQMCAGLAPAVSGTVRLELTGPGGGTWIIAPAGDAGRVSIVEGDGDAEAVVRSSAHDFVSWGTTRSDWRAACDVSGDAVLATAVLDAIDVI